LDKPKKVHNKNNTPKILINIFLYENKFGVGKLVTTGTVTVVIGVFVNELITGGFGVIRDGIVVGGINGKIGLDVDLNVDTGDCGFVVGGVVV